MPCGIRPLPFARGAPAEAARARRAVPTRKPRTDTQRPNRHVTCAPKMAARAERGGSRGGGAAWRGVTAQAPARPSQRSVALTPNPHAAPEPTPRVRTKDGGSRGAWRLARVEDLRAAHGPRRGQASGTSPWHRTHTPRPNRHLVCARRMAARAERGGSLGGGAACAARGIARSVAARAARAGAHAPPGVPARAGANGEGPAAEAAGPSRVPSERQRVSMRSWVLSALYWKMPIDASVGSPFSSNVTGPETPS